MLFPSLNLENETEKRKAKFWPSGGMADARDLKSRRVFPQPPTTQSVTQRPHGQGAVSGADLFE